MRLRRLAPLALAATALLLAACEEAEAPATPAPTPTPTPVLDATPTPADTSTATPTPEPTPVSEPIALDENGLPEGAVGPLVVDATGPRQRLPNEVVTYDVGAGGQVARFVLPGGSLPNIVGLVGHEVITGDSGFVYRDLNGDETRTLFAVDERFDGFSILMFTMLSPDRSLIVIPEPDFEPCGGVCLHFVDVATGEIVRTIRQTAITLDGGAAPWRWRDDSQALVLMGVPNGHRAVGFASVTVEGTQLSHFPDLGSVSPSGRRAALYRDQCGADLADSYFFADSLRLVSLDSGEEIAVTPGTTVAIDDADIFWSPDGDVLLYGARDPGALDFSAASCARVFEEIAQKPRAWFALSVEGGPAEPIEDPAALMASWSEGRRFTFSCDGAVRGGDRLFGDSRFRALPCVDDDGGLLPSTLTVDGHDVVSAEVIELLGIIDLDE